MTISFAESCTGGGAAWLLTSVPGISRVFERSFVTYSNQAKRDLLGVPAAVLEAHGAVSPACVEAMAEGVARAAGARLGVSISGIAGPEGGTVDKPVGTIHFGVHLDGRTIAVERRYPSGWGRGRLRSVARRMALYLALRELRASSPS